MIGASTGKQEITFYIYVIDISLNVHQNEKYKNFGRKKIIIQN